MSKHSSTRVIIYVVLVAAVLFGGIYSLQSAREPADFNSPEQLARGEYLVENVALCMDCHTERDWNFMAAPVTATEVGTGGSAGWFREGAGDAPAITPRRLEQWTNAELANLVSLGVNSESGGIHPAPGSNRIMTRDDAYAIVAYLRTLPSPEESPNDSKPTVLDPAHYDDAVMPDWYPFLAPIDSTDSSGQGEYLAGIASCTGCHGADMSGGVRFTLPDGGTVRSANLTPDPETGIPYDRFDRSSLVKYIKSFDPETAEYREVREGSSNTVMPWTRFGGMIDHDIEAIYDYMSTRWPVKKDVRALSKQDQE